MKLDWLDPYLPHVALSRSPSLSELSTLADEPASITRVVCLQQTHEFVWFDHTLEDRRAVCEAAGLTLLHDPIEDFAAPTLAQARRLATLLLEPERTLLHCQAGLGRAGTIAACALLLRVPEFDAPGAIAMIRYLRPGAIQSEVQERLISAFATSRA